MMNRIATFLLLSASLGFCQQAGQPFQYSTRVLDSVSERYGIVQATSPARQAAQPQILDLTSTSAWLAQRYPDSTHRVKPGIALREFSKSFAVMLHENESYWRFDSVGVDIRLRDTPEAAGRAAAAYLASIAVEFDKGSFSGSPVGNWTASRFTPGKRASLVFLRGNAFVYVSYAAPAEVSKVDKSRRVILPDASLRQKCEDLARDIDAELLKLLVAEKEVK